MKNKSIDIFYKTYSRDFKLLKYSLMSIKKNVTGYNKIIIIVPEHEKEQFQIFFFGFDFKNTDIHYVKEYGNGYLFQQACKLQAHKYCNSDFILFSDSDCIFSREIDLQKHIKSGKPEILMTSYFDEKGFNNVGGALCWQYPTQLFFNQECTHELMRRNCLIYHTSTLKNLEQRFIKSNPNQTLEGYVMSQERFSEFNVIGKFAHLYESKKYKFIDTKNWKYETPLGEQLWSWFSSGTDEVHIKEKQRVLEVINKTFDLKLTEI